MPRSLQDTIDKIGQEVDESLTKVAQEKNAQEKLSNSASSPTIKSDIVKSISKLAESLKNYRPSPSYEVLNKVAEDAKRSFK